MPALRDGQDTADDAALPPALLALPADLPADRADDQNRRSGRLTLGWRGPDSLRLTALHQEAPLRALFPLEPGGADAVVVNTAGGVVGGDRMAVQVDLAGSAAALVTSQAAEKVYRSAGAVARLETHLRVGAGSVLAWLPQETILFDACRLRRHLSIDLDPAARLLASEMLVFGRLARAEVLHGADLREAWDVRVDGRLVWAERFRLTPPNAEILDGPVLVGRAKALATTVFAAPDAPDRLADARTHLAILPGVRAGVTAVNGLLVGRFAGPDPAFVRRSLGATLAAWRGVLLDQPARLPRLWAI